MVKVDFEFRRNIVYGLLELSKQNLLSNKDKNEFFKIVNNLDERTQIQKHRFCLLYNLYAEEKNSYILSEIARMEIVRPSAVKQSVARVRNSLVNANDEDIMKLFEILKKYK